MRSRHAMLTLVLAFAAAPLALADSAKQQNGGSSSSGAHMRQPSSSGGSSHAKASSGGESSHSKGGSSQGSSASAGSSGDSSTAHARSGAERRYPRPRQGGQPGTRDRDRVGPGGYEGRYYRPSYRLYPYRRWSYYPYYGWYDGYYYGYYGWPAPYVRVSHTYETGAVRVQIEPEDTEVFVDGYFAGRVDDFNGIFQRLYLRPGRHELLFKKQGYRTHRVRLYAAPGHTLRIRYEMVPGSGAPSESVVGTPEPEEAEDPDTADTEDGVTADTADAEPGRIELAVEPADASVYVDGTFHSQGGRRVSVDLAPGAHRIEVVRPGFKGFEQTIEVEEGRTIRLTIVLARATDRI